MSKYICYFYDLTVSKDQVLIIIAISSYKLCHVKKLEKLCVRNVFLKILDSQCYEIR